VTFDVVTGYSLAAIVKATYRIEKAMRTKSFDVKDIEILQNILTISVEVVFFLYSMDFRVRTTYLVAQFMLISAKIAKIDDALHNFVVSKLINGALSTLRSRMPGESGGIESLNLLIAMKAVNPSYQLSCDDLLIFTGHKEIDKSKIECLHYNYFHFVVVLYYIRNINDYTDLSYLLKRN